MFVYKLLLLVCSVIYVACDELFMITPQILEHRKTAYERHEVVTEDGYILSIFRIPKQERRGVVVLQHSLGLDSSIFLVSEKRSIAMDIYNAGFELWLPNFRGLPFSDKHENPKISRFKYWNFSFHEIGYYDLSAILNHVSNVTGTKVIVINHSLSSTASLVYSALRPREAERNVKLFVNQATSAFMYHIQSPLRYFLGIYSNVLKPMAEILNIGAINYEFRPFVQMGKRLALLLFPTDFIQSLTEMSMEIFLGQSRLGMDPEEFPMIMSIGLQTIVIKIVSHYVQIILSGRFCMYDYGEEENLRRYNASEPPDYPLEAIRVPIYLVISDADTMSDARGSNKLYDKLPDAAKIYGKMEVQGINHADYLSGKGRFDYFKNILKFIKSIN